MSDRTELRLPVIEESAVVSRRDGATEHVRVHTSVDTREELVTGDLQVEAIEIDRRAVDRAVDVAPPPREDGGTTIISIVEERAVLTRQLFVVEEIVIRHRTTLQPFAVPVTLRRTRADIERTTETSQYQEEN